MTSTIELPQVRRKEGAQSTTSGAPEILSFEYDGDIYSVAVTHKIPAAPVLDWRARVAQLQKDSGLLDDIEQMERIQELGKRAQGMTFEQSKDVLTVEERQELFAFNSQIQNVETENAPALFSYRAAIVCGLIKAWNFAEALPTVEDFSNDNELAEALIPLVWAWHFPTSVVPVEAPEAEPTNTSKSTSTTRAKHKAANSLSDS